MPRRAEFKPDCKRCRRLVSFLKTTRKQFPDYHCQPVDAFGDPAARLLIVGLAPGLHGANKTGRPFTGDASGEMLFRTLHAFNFASSPESLNTNDGLKLHNCRITNAVKCLPPANKPTAAEVNNCYRYLFTEVSELADQSVIIALGKVAHDAVIKTLIETSVTPLKKADLSFAHNKSYRLQTKQGERLLISSYHCSRYNTQTKRLTQAMFNQVFEKARYYLEV